MVGSRQVAWILLGLLAVGIVTAGCQKSREPDKPPVEIVAYYPLNEGHLFIAEYLEELAAKHPDRINLEVIDFRTSEGRERWAETGLGCAGVFVNGSTRHEIVRADGTTDTVDFIKRMDVFWSRDDFETVLYELMGEPKPAKEEPAAKAEGEAEAEGEADTEAESEPESSK